MDEYNKATQRVITVSKKKLIWIIVVLVVIGFLLWGFFVFVRPVREVYFEGGSGISVPSAPGIALEDSVVGKKIYPEPYPRKRPDVTDTREFLKTDYRAQIETREVQDSVRQVEDAVHRVEGRVDGISSSERHGYVSFVIPKTRLFEFRDAIEAITHEKLLVETITSQNLLSQKQDIEDRTEDVVRSLVELEKEKKNLDLAHAQRLSSIQAQITALQNQLNVVRAAEGALDEEDENYNAELLNLNNQDVLLSQQINNLLTERTNENGNYTRQNNNLVAQINKKGGDLGLLAEEDTDFMDDIETVNGYVNVQWINLWNLADKLTPTPMWLNTLVLVLLILWYLKRARVLPIIRLV